MPILDRIKFDGVGNNESWIVYKMDLENIAWGSQLIVGMGQEAIFIKSGKAQDIFTPGTYTLKSGNLPLLRGLMSLPFGGKTPFSAEVVFINKTNNLGFKWGTNSPINMEDPKYGILLGLRAFGQFGVKIADSRLFVNQLIGTIKLDSGFNHNLIWQQFNSLINTRLKTMLMKFLNEKQISFLQIAEYYEELSRMAFGVLQQDFDNSGLDLINFFVESISPPKEQYEKLRQYKEELSLGERFYDKRRSFDVLEGLASSPIAGIYTAPSLTSIPNLISQFQTVYADSDSYTIYKTSLTSGTYKLKVADKNINSSLLSTYSDPVSAHICIYKYDGTKKIYYYNGYYNSSSSSTLPSMTVEESEDYYIVCKAYTSGTSGHFAFSLYKSNE